MKLKGLTSPAASREKPSSAIPKIEKKDETDLERTCIFRTIPRSKLASGIYAVSFWKTKFLQKLYPSPLGASQTVPGLSYLWSWGQTGDPGNGMVILRAIIF